MTYCAGILVDDGLVMIADTRTNAGLDNVATYRKLHLFEEPGEKAIVVATAGNLAMSQSVLTHAAEGLVNPETGEREILMDMPSMFRAAQFLGAAMRTVRKAQDVTFEQAQPGLFDMSMLVGGQVRGGRLRLFLIYNEGNFIEATVDTPYLQIGEHKYGKPILDRSIRAETSLDNALKLALISMDSTIRSNLGVGLPIDIVTVRRDAAEAELVFRIGDDEPYFGDLRERWSHALTEAHTAIPAPPYRRS